MKHKTIQLLLLPLVFSTACLKAQYSFNSLDSLLAFASINSATSKVAAQQSLLAKWTKIAAMANSINFRNPLSFSATNNILLPVNFIPGEAFGGPAGTFRQITLGQQYVSGFNFNPQIDIINPQSLARVKSASLNTEITEVNNNIVKKLQHESIAAAYYNCIALNEQIESSEKNLVLADSLVLIIANRYEAGIAREYDLNNASVNKLTVRDKLQQLKISHSQQLNALKILCDIPANTALSVSSQKNNSFTTLQTSTSLESKYILLQSRYLKSELGAARLSMLPVLSLVYYQGWQKNSTAGFIDNAAPWIQSKYIGLRLTLPFPPDVNKLSQSYTSKISYSISAINAAHTGLQNELANRSLELDLEKTATSFETAKQIMELKTNNYTLSLNQYMEGILPADLLITAFNDLLNSRLNLATSRAMAEYSKARLIINNSFK